MPKPYGEVNVELFQKVKEKILEEPRRLDMKTWQNNFPPALADKYDFLPPCGTTACIAGWALLICGKTAQDFDSSEVASHAGELLGIPPEHYTGIFTTVGWPPEFRTAYCKACPVGAEERAKVAAKFIDYICGVEPLE